jgi:hypothetical protein
MNEANERDPFNNNSYGTPSTAAIDVASAGARRASTSTSASSAATKKGPATKKMPADLSVARSLIPAGTATLRDFSYIAPEIPEYNRETAPAAWTASRFALTRRFSARCSRESDLEKLQTIRRARPIATDVPNAQWSKHPQILRRPRRRSAKGECSPSSSIPASAKVARSASPFATTTRCG